MGYRQHPRVGVAEDFSVKMKIKLQQGTSVRNYSVGGSVKPSKHLKDAVVTTLSAPRMELATEPDGRNKGHLGIALDVSAGEGEFECRKVGLPKKADVEVESQNGTVMHRGDATLGKLVFG